MEERKRVRGYFDTIVIVASTHCPFFTHAYNSTLYNQQGKTRRREVERNGTRRELLYSHTLHSYYTSILLDCYTQGEERQNKAKK